MTEPELRISRDLLTNMDGRSLAAEFMRLGVQDWQVRAAWTDRTRFRRQAGLPVDTPEACGWTPPEE